MRLPGNTVPREKRLLGDFHVKGQKDGQSDEATWYEVRKGIAQKAGERLGFCVVQFVKHYA